MRNHRLHGIAAVVALLLGAGANGLDAQAASASASTLALSGNNTALVRGFGALSVNPAGLAMPGSGFSLALAPVRVRAGLHPVSVWDLADFEGQVVPSGTKQAWLTDVAAAGGEAGTAETEIAGISLTIGNVGFQVSGIAASKLVLPPDAVEAYLYGNGGRTGAATDLDLTGSSVDAFGLTTAGLSLALPFGPVWKVGVTGKYVRGHGLAVARATSASFSSAPIELNGDFPAVTTCLEEDSTFCEQDFLDGGSGIGADVGVMYDGGDMVIGASVLNVFNTFEWDTSRLGFRPGTFLVEQGNSDTDFDEVGYDSAPAELKSIVEDMGFKPYLQVGVAMDLTSMLTVTGDVHRRLGENGLGLQPDTHVGAGAELRLPFLHLRGGGAVVSGGSQISGGASLVVGPVNLSAAVARQMGDDLHDATLAQFVLSFGNR